ADFRSFYTCLTASRCKGFERILIKGLAPIFDIIRSNSLYVLDFLFVQQSLIKDGKIMEDNLKKEKFTTDDLLESLRNKDIFKAADVEFAILEPSGTVNVLPKKENKTLTLKDIGIEPASEKEPQTVIMDGKMLL